MDSWPRIAEILVYVVGGVSVGVLVGAAHRYALMEVVRRLDRIAKQLEALTPDEPTDTARKDGSSP